MLELRRQRSVCLLTLVPVEGEQIHSLCARGQGVHARQRRPVVQLYCFGGLGGCAAPLQMQRQRRQRRRWQQEIPENELASVHQLEAGQGKKKPPHQLEAGQGKKKPPHQLEAGRERKTAALVRPKAVLQPAARCRRRSRSLGQQCASHARSIKLVGGIAETSEVQ